MPSAAHKHSCHVHQQSRWSHIACMAIGLLLALVGCGGGDGDAGHFFKDPSGAPIRTTVRTGVPLAYASSVAMASVAGSRPPNASLSNTCPTYPCASLVTISDNDSTVPLQLAPFGAIRVYGYWNSPDRAILTVAFSGTGGGISLVPVTTSGNTLKVVYGGINVTDTVTDPQTLTTEERNLIYLRLQSTASDAVSDNVAMDGWIVVRDDVGTTDLSDDTYRISGGGQYIDTTSGATVFQLGMSQVIMGPACALNPTSGVYLVNECGTPSDSSPLGVVATAFITFHSACDGTADVSGATGNYLLSNGKSIPLSLSGP